MTRVRIVTDSTADLPPAWAERLGVTVVPCYLNIGTQSLRDGIDLERDDFYRRLPELDAFPHTAAPPSGVFAELYAALGRDGAEIVSLHPPAALSGIANSARLGAEQSGLSAGRVQVIDAGQLSMGLGWQVVRAAELAAQDPAPSAAAIAAGLAGLPERVRVFAALDTLEFLRRSGRVSWAQAGLGSLLQLKLIIELYAGAVQSRERVRTRARSIERLVEIALALGPLERLAVMHTAALADAEALCRRLAPLAGGSEVPIVTATPVIGAHVGPRALGFAALPAALPAA